MFRAACYLALICLLVPSNVLSQGTPGIWAGDYSMPRGCSWHVIAMDAASDGKVYLSIQGNVCGQESGTLFAYDPAENDFSAIGDFSSDLSSNYGVNVIRSDGSDIYVGGSFTHIDGLEVNGIARLDTQTGSWSALDQGGSVGMTDGFWISDILVTDADIFVAGNFFEMGGAAAQGVARWDRSLEQWHSMAGGITGPEHGTGASLYMADDGTLYLGGFFEEVGNQDASNVAAWDGAQWASLGSGANDRVNAIIAFDGGVYIGGRFTQAGGKSISGIAEWDGEDWQQIGSGLAAPLLRPSVYQMSIADGYLYVGGYFNSINGVDARNLARRNLTTGDWHALGSGSDGGLSRSSKGILLRRGVSAFTVMDDHLYAGGDITRAEGQAVNNIARFDLVAEHWSPIGQDIGDGLSAQDTRNVEFTGRGLLVTGPISQSGLLRSYQVTRRRLADAIWSRFADNDERFFIGGLPGHTLALGEEIFLAGGMLFSSSSAPDSPTPDVLVNGIVRWNSDSGNWEPLIDADSGSIGVGGTVISITGHDETVYVSGPSSAGGQPVERIARWNTTSQTWAPLGDGLDQFARAMITDDSGLLYAGGGFGMAGGQPANGVALWIPDTGTWSALGDGITNSDGTDVSVSALGLNHDGDLLVGGRFDTAGSMSVNSLARWDGAQWHDLGNGLTNADGDPGLVRAIAVSESGDIFVGGWFTHAGELAVSNLARWDGSQWNMVGADENSSGIGGPANQGVSDLALLGPDLVAVGRFSQAGGQVAANFAHFVRDLGGADLDISIDVEELDGPSSGDPEQLSIRTTSGLLYVIEVRNLGMNAANNVEFSITADPVPESVEWTCEPLPETDAICPQDSGNGLPDLVFNLPQQSGLRFEILVSVDSDEPYSQELSAGASGDQVFDGDNSQSQSSSTTTVNDRIFQDRFE